MEQIGGYILERFKNLSIRIESLLNSLDSIEGYSLRKKLKGLNILEDPLDTLIVSRKYFDEVTRGTVDMFEYWSLEQKLTKTYCIYYFCNIIDIPPPTSLIQVHCYDSSQWANTKEYRFCLTLDKKEYSKNWWVIKPGNSRDNFLQRIRQWKSI